MKFFCSFHRKILIPPVWPSRTDRARLQELCSCVTGKWLVTQCHQRNWEPIRHRAGFSDKTPVCRKVLQDSWWNTGQAFPHWHAKCHGNQEGRRDRSCVYLDTCSTRTSIQTPWTTSTRYLGLESHSNSGVSRTNQKANYGEFIGGLETWF